MELFFNSLAFFWHWLDLVAWSKEVHVHSHKIVVNPSTVKRKESHHQNHVSQVTEHLQWRSLNHVVPINQENTKDEQSCTVSDVSEHHTEEKGESYSCENWRVDLLITRYTISVGDLLGNNCITIGVKGSWRVANLNLMQRRCRYHLHQTSPKHFQLFLRHIQLSINNLLPELKLIQRLIDHPLFPQENPPAFQIPNVLNLMQEPLHFLLIHPDIINHFVILLS